MQEVVMEILRLHVLIVNEDPTLLSRMGEILAEQGFTYQSAKNKSEAQRLLENEAFQVLVTDMTMPDNDGVELCKKYGHRMPVVMLQGSTNDKAQNQITSFSCCFLDKGDIGARLGKATWTAFKRFKIDQQIERDLVAA
jgi:DNA-binding NtrC family response regulator